MFKLDATREDLPRIEPRVGFEPPGVFDVLGAGFTSEAIETDFWHRRDRVEGSIYEEAWSAYQSAVGEDVARQRLQGAVGRSRYPLTSWTSPKHQTALLGLLSEAQAETPDAFSALPSELSQGREAIRTLAISRMRAEYQDAADTLALGQGASATIAEFVGRAGAAVTDQVSLATLPFGVVGRAPLLKVFTREATLGAASEAAILPRMFDVADELDIERPNVAAQIALGAVAGGVLGTAPDAAVRLVQYAALRRAPTAPEKIAEQDQVEAAIEADAATVPLPKAEPDVEAPEGADAPVRAPESQPEAPQTETAQASDVMTEEDAIADARANAPEVLDMPRPLSQRIAALGKIQSRQLDPATGEMVPTPLAQELAVRGVTPRTHLFLFNNKTGRADLDNITPGEIFSDGESPLRLDDTGNYIDREALIDALVNEVTNGVPLHTSRAAREALELLDGRIEEANRAATGELSRPVAATIEEVEDVVRDRLMDDFLDADAYFARERDHLINPDQALERPEFGGLKLKDSERGRVASYMDSGMDPVQAIRYHAARTISEEADAPNARTGRQAKGTEPSQSGLGEGATGRRQPSASQARETATGGGDAGIASERTDAGEQSLIPGVDPVTQRQRLEAAQDAPLRGGERPVDGLFDLGARAQMDIFDNPTSPEAARLLDSAEADARAFFEEGPGADFANDVEIRLEGETVTARSLFDDMKADADHLAAIEACQFGGKT